MNNLVSNWNNIQIGATIHNENGDDYAVIAINPEQDRTLLVKKGTKYPYYVGAWFLHQCRNGTDWCWGQGHYFMENLDSAVEYVMDIKKEEM
jgi:hypothetical protein